MLFLVMVLLLFTFYFFGFLMLFRSRGLFMRGFFTSKLSCLGWWLSWLWCWFFMNSSRCSFRCLSFHFSFFCNWLSSHFGRWFLWCLYFLTSFLLIIDWWLFLINRSFNFFHQLVKLLGLFLIFRILFRFNFFFNKLMRIFLLHMLSLS